MPMPYSRSAPRVSPCSAAAFWKNLSLICVRMPTRRRSCPRRPCPRGVQMFHDLQRVVNGFVALAPLDVHHSADAAVVMLKPGAVQPGGGLALGKVFHTSFAPFPIPLNRAASHICRAGGINKKDAPNRAHRPLVGTSLFLSASYHRCRRFTIPKQKILRKLSEKRLEIWFSKRKLNKIKLRGLSAAL